MKIPEGSPERSLHKDSGELEALSGVNLALLSDCGGALVCLGFDCQWDTVVLV
jgi:hypothetical protein